MAYLLEPLAVQLDLSMPLAAVKIEGICPESGDAINATPRTIGLLYH